MDDLSKTLAKIDFRDQVAFLDEEDHWLALEPLTEGFLNAFWLAPVFGYCPGDEWRCKLQALLDQYPETKLLYIREISPDQVGERGVVY